MQDIILSKADEIALGLEDSRIAKYFRYYLVEALSHLDHKVQSKHDLNLLKLKGLKKFESTGLSSIDSNIRGEINNFEKRIGIGDDEFTDSYKRRKGKNDGQGYRI